jgi:hypothetical protein
LDRALNPLPNGETICACPLHSHAKGRLKFCNAKAPNKKTTKRLTTDIAKRIKKHLVKKGYSEEYEDLVGVSKVRVGAKVKKVLMPQKNDQCQTGPKSYPHFSPRGENFARLNGHGIPSFRH